MEVNFFAFLTSLCTINKKIKVLLVLKHQILALKLHDTEAGLPQYIQIW